MTVAVALVAVLLLVSKNPFRSESHRTGATGQSKSTGLASLPARFWLYAALVLLYGVVETLNGNWATIYLGGSPEFLPEARRSGSRRSGRRSQPDASSLVRCRKGFRFVGFTSDCPCFWWWPFRWCEFAGLSTLVSGELIAFYQVGYGVAAFGVGPLRDLTGLSFSRILSLGSIAAGAMVVLAWLVIRGQNRTVLN